MRRIAFALFMLWCLAALLVQCSDEAVFVAGPTSGAGASGASGGTGGSGAGGSPGCQGFGDACTECTVESACNAGYCACLASETCGALWQCIIGCGPGNADCVDGCELMYPDAYSQLVLLFDCMGAECGAECNFMPFGPCFECWLTDCSTGLDACVGDVECNEYIDCIAACTDGACLAGCYAALTDTTLADALATCVQANCQDAGECPAMGACQPLNTPCTQCAYDSPVCNPIYCSCFSNPACGGYAQCINACAPMDEACADNCELTYSAGYSALYQVFGCMGSECSADCGFGQLPPCFQCLVTTCSTELDACQGDTECNEFIDCSSQCTDLICEALCYGALTDTTEADALSTCLQGPCGADCSGAGGAGGAGP